MYTPTVGGKGRAVNLQVKQKKNPLVFRDDLKVIILGLCLIKSGRQFHNFGAHTESKVLNIQVL